MSSTLLERARSSHEWVESFETTIVEQLEKKPRTNKEKVYQQHRVNNLVNGIVEQSQELDDFYKDKDGIFRDEIMSMRGQHAFHTFYRRLRETREYHVRNPGVLAQNKPPMNHLLEVPVSLFSGEELYGRFLDLHRAHETYINLPNFPQLEYVQYLEIFAEFSKIEASKKGRKYVEYLTDLFEYIKGFFKRTQPLVGYVEVEEQIHDQFNQIWSKGLVPGWTKEAEGAADKDAENASASARALNLDHFHTADQLKALGMARLKEALEALGMKCGGTLDQRADRLFSVKGVAKEAIPPKLLANKGKRKRQDDHSDGDRKEIALMEFEISALYEQMKDVVMNTRKQVERKQTKTMEEREAEIREEEEGTGVAAEDELAEDEDEDEDSEDEGPIYNPLNLPLGWDGKPIPYWLYKLHGLGVEYKCEICGDYSYMGRRAFDRHFQEWRHAHGMRCLGIPNTKHFHDITLIEDATALFDKIKDQLAGEMWNADMEEEYEDSEGNVLNRRTYEDLARQGLL